MRTLRTVAPISVVALQAPTAAVGQATDALVHNYLEALVREQGIPGLTTAVVREGEVVYSGHSSSRAVLTHS